MIKDDLMSVFMIRRQSFLVLLYSSFKSINSKMPFSILDFFLP